jgi:hypothetical protein
LSENRPRPLHYWTGCRTRSRTSSPTSAAWYQLRPPELDELGLVTALREHTDRLTESDLPDRYIWTGSL